MNIHDFKKKKQAAEKISCITCYDYSSAVIAAKSDIDSVLVGDSLSMTIYGYPSTVNADMRMMTAHTEAVARGLSKSGKFIIGDMPFQTYRKGIDKAVEAASALIMAGAHAVKLEGADGNIDIIRHLVEGGIPVMGHLGLTPQFVNTLGGFKVQGKTDDAAQKIKNDALALQNAGCFSMVLEGVPSSVARDISQSLSIPTIGIGAGTDCDGQVLVWQDFLGINKDFKPKFVRYYADQHDDTLRAINQIHKDISNKIYPNVDESY